MILKPILRKAEFTTEVLSVIVAVAGVLLIGYLGVKLYNFFISQDEKNAATFLDGIQAKIEALEDGENNTFVLRGVKDWVLVAWNKDVRPDDKPQKCFDKNCLCLCKDKPDKGTCQDKGICRDVDRNIKINTIYSYSYYVENIKENSQRDSKCIYLSETLSEVYLIKLVNEITLSTNVTYTGEKEDFFSLSSNWMC